MEDVYFILSGLKDHSWIILGVWKNDCEFDRLDAFAECQNPY